MTSHSKSTPPVHQIKAIFEGFQHITGRPHQQPRGRSYNSQASADIPKLQTEHILLTPEPTNAFAESIETVIDSPPHHDRPKLNSKPSWVGPVPRSPIPSANATAMSHKVTVRYQAPDLLPPVYITTSLSEPQWQIIEMDASRLQDGVYTFHKDFEVAEGEYQYKFRFGPGDWWVCDESQPTIDDEDGNRNNIIFVTSEQVHSLDQKKKTDSVIDASPVTISASSPEQSVAVPHHVEPAKSTRGSTLNETTTEDSVTHVGFKGADEKGAGREQPHHEHDDDVHVEHDPVPLLKHETSYPGQIEEVSMETMLSSPASSAAGNSILEDIVCPEPDPADTSLHRFPTHHAGIVQEIQRAAQRSSPDNATIEGMTTSPSSRSASALSLLTTPLLPSVQEERDSEEVLVMISDNEDSGGDGQRHSRGVKHNGKHHRHRQPAEQDMKEEGIVNEKKLLAQKSDLADLAKILFGVVFAAVIAVIALIMYSTGMTGQQDVKDGSAVLGP